MFQDHQAENTKENLKRLDYVNSVYLEDCRDTFGYSLQCSAYVWFQVLQNQLRNELISFFFVSRKNGCINAFRQIADDRKNAVASFFLNQKTSIILHKICKI